MDASQIVINTPRELAAMIEGRSDAEINEAVAAIGQDSALQKVFEGMTKAFLPDQAKGQTAIIQWDIQAGGSTATYQVKVDGGACSFQKGAPDKPRVTLNAALPDFLRLITGKANGQQMFFSGKLKLAGDMMFAMTQEKWFDKNMG